MARKVRLRDYRDIYYRNVPLFQRQAVVDTVRPFSYTHDQYKNDESGMQLVDDLACTFDLSRAELNVVKLFIFVDLA